jgi:hypothetical protein
MTQDMENETNLWMGTDKMIPRYVYGQSSTIRFPYRSDWKDRLNTDWNGGLIWYILGSKTNKGTKDGVYAYGTKRKLSSRLGQYTTVFQAEVYTIKACVAENLIRNYRNINIYEGCP